MGRLVLPALNVAQTYLEFTFGLKLRSLGEAVTYQATRAINQHAFERQGPSPNGKNPQGTSSNQRQYKLDTTGRNQNWLRSQPGVAQGLRNAA